MRPQRLPLLLVLILAFALTPSRARISVVAATDLPTSLTDQEFWRLTVDLSEPNGVYEQSENLISNEMVLWRLVPELVAHAKPGGVYLGVGPEQNFSYVAALRPRMAFITDIRRGNLHVLLMYKALLELSAERADFVSLLFTKPRPAGLSATSTVNEIMNAYWDTKSSDEAVYAANLEAIRRHLTKTRALPLSAEDLDGIGRTYRAFYWYGPAMTYTASTTLRVSVRSRDATYRHLMTEVDTAGQAVSYLATEEKFKFVKDLHDRNLVIPVVGNFSGPKAIRSIGAFVRSHGAIVTAFYVSTVEPYLRNDGTMGAFCANVATLPIDDASVFIRPGSMASLRGADPSVFSRPPGVTTQIGVYFTGVIVKMATGCG